MATFEKRGPYQIRAKVRRKGHRTVTKTFENMANARSWARDVESEMDHGTYTNIRVAEQTTLRTTLLRYHEEVFPRLANGGLGEKARLWRLINELGDLSLATLESFHIAKYRDQRIKVGAAPQTVKHEIGLLNRVLKHCIMDWGIPLPRGIVTAQVRKPPLPSGRDRRLEEDEEKRLIEAAEKSKSRDITSVIIIGLETAARCGEIAGMKWEHINFAKKTWHIPITKTKVPRTVPLSPKAIETLNELKKLPRRIDGRVWSLSSHSISQAFTRICRQAKIEGFHFHDLRHEATSRLFEKNGFGIMEVASITGHKTLTMLKRYTHLRAEDLAAKMG
jgi:integrase